MKTAIYAAATIACLAGAPGVASAATAVDRPIQLAQDVRIGVGPRDDYERPGWRWRHRHEGCREVTIRERRGGEMVVRHIRRCD
jgi:hypothetical protein